MADRLDVTGRLAEGAQSVDHTQRYVWATALMGYQNADLTTYSMQVVDAYHTEDGLDLAVLDADWAAFDAATVAVADAATGQRDQLKALAAAWTGDGADTAAQFLLNHCDAADILVQALGSTAATLATLRDGLWTAVDNKVTGVVEVDDRRLVERPTWLAAADTVITSVGDRTAAGELVELAVKPYVDTDIRNDWMAVVEAAAAAVRQAYATAVAELTAAVVPVFEIPSGLAPQWTPNPTTPSSVPANPQPSAPVVAESVPVTSPMAYSPGATGSVGTEPAAITPVSTAPPESAVPTSTAPAVTAPTEPAAGSTSADVPATSTMPSAGSSLPQSGIGELLNGFADSLGGLLGSSSGMPTEGVEPLGVEPLGEEAAIEPPETETSEEEDPDEEDVPPDETPEGDVPSEEEPGVEPAPVVEPEPEPELEPEPEAAPVAPTPTAEPTGAPCEIPPDELPQVGE